MRGDAKWRCPPFAGYSRIVGGPGRAPGSGPPRFTGFSWARRGGGLVPAASDGPARGGPPDPSPHGLASQECDPASGAQVFLPPPDELPASRDGVELFLSQMTERSPPPILISPSPPLAPATLAAPGKSRHPSAVEASRGPGLRSSGRLTAKPTAGMPSLEKARLVLLRKEGFCAGNKPPMEDELLRYKDLYKRELPPGFIAAIKSLVSDAMPPGKKKDEKRGTIPAAVASLG